MRFLTVINLTGLKAREAGEWVHHLSCPWCGEDAWTISDYFQCRNKTCRIQTAAPEDLLAYKLGGYRKAAEFIADKYNVEPDYDGAEKRQRERTVLDFWVKNCLAEPTNEAAAILGKSAAKGMDIRNSHFSAVALDSRQTQELVDLAIETGAEFPDSWREQAPSSARVFCVQSNPTRVDRMLVITSRGRMQEIVWNYYTAGFCSLIGLDPARPKLLTADIDAALQLQAALSLRGRREFVASLYTDLSRGGSCPRWDAPVHLLTAVPRHCHSRVPQKFHNPDDVANIQMVLDQFPGIEGAVKGLPFDVVADNAKDLKDAVPWGKLRFGMIASMVPAKASQVPSSCASVFEQTGNKEEDTIALVNYFRKRGRHQVANDFETLSMTRIISRDSRSLVKETANDYRVVQGTDTNLLANFNLRIHSNVTFRNLNAERYCQAVLRCGSATTEVLFPQHILHDKIQNLEAAVQRQLTIDDKVNEAGKLPTIIAPSKFRTLILPHLRTQAAKAKPVVGVDRLGWSEDRRSFTFPGFILTRDGSEKTGKILCPDVPILRHYKALRVTQWAESAPMELSQTAMDVVSIMIASVVRYFRRSKSRPVQIAQSSAAMTILDRVMRAFGQKEIYALNQNVRDGAHTIDGVHGYPMVAAGPESSLGLSATNHSFLHLTDSGLPIDPSCDAEQAVNAAAAAQHFTREVVRWCLHTGGDAFREAQSVKHASSLMREGQWLIDNVCDAEGWSISHAETTALEKLLAQIPYEEAGRRITLFDGTEINIDVRGLKHDHDGIIREARDMGTMAAFEDDKIISPAAKMLPAISNFYGQDPDVTLVVT